MQPDGADFVVLHNRWCLQEPPFDANVFISPWLSAEVLRDTLVGVVDLLPSAVSLRTFEDWRDHDGFVNSVKAQPWEALGRSVAHEQTFVKWSSRAWSVCRTWFPTDFPWQLRWCRDPFEEPTDPGSWFDVAAGHEVIDRLVALVPHGEVDSAQTHFDGRWRQQIEKSPIFSRSERRSRRRGNEVKPRID